MGYSKKELKILLNAMQKYEDHTKGMGGAQPKPILAYKLLEKLKSECLSVGEILQHIYDSEIHLSIGWLWDGGFNYKVGADLSYIEGVEKSTEEDKIDVAIIIIAKDVAAQYPNSVFAKWWADAQS